MSSLASELTRFQHPQQVHIPNRGELAISVAKWNISEVAVPFFFPMQSLQISASTTITNILTNSSLFHYLRNKERENIFTISSSILNFNWCAPMKPCETEWCCCRELQVHGHIGVDPYNNHLPSKTLPTPTQRT